MADIFGQTTVGTAGKQQQSWRVLGLHHRPVLSKYSPTSPLCKWLGRQDSNLRMRGSKPRALPLGYAPVIGLHLLQQW